MGENPIDHTPTNEIFEIYTANSLDPAGERKVTDFESNNRENWIKETIEIILKIALKSPRPSPIESIFGAGPTKKSLLTTNSRRPIPTLLNSLNPFILNKLRY